jgi:DNA repair protein RadC
MRPPIEFKIMRIRECPSPSQQIETPEQAMQYWRANILSADWYDESKECLVVLILNTGRRIIGHNLVSLGGLNTCFCHSREVFRRVIVAAGHAAILMHNHPSGDPSTSTADIQVTRELSRLAGCSGSKSWDHVIVGVPVTVKWDILFGRKSTLDALNYNRQSLMQA